ncbi:MAG: hypothetical protein KBT88_08455 [Gammaproteobacteria bacterium]|nr:hypothetical protein [Gammaproteobacteria bacterium]MBQ0839805.1 hypothetical protein [Gammaproteobacteria bacterium]
MFGVVVQQAGVAVGVAVGVDNLFEVLVAIVAQGADVASLIGYFDVGINLRLTLILL